MDTTRLMIDKAFHLFIPITDNCLKLERNQCNTFLLYFGLPSSPITPVQDDDGDMVIATSEFETEPESDVTDDNTSNEIVYKTFFSEVSHTFSVFHDLPFEEYQSQLFLDTCEEYFSIVVKFTNPIFSPLKADVNANITRLRESMNQDPIKFNTLYGIINDEIESDTTNARNSATNALLWLKRVFEFLSCFLHEFGLGDKSLVDAAIKGYDQTLKQHHGLIARSIFPLALRAVPSDVEFLRLLAIDPADAAEPHIERQLFQEILEHTTIATAVLDKITVFYKEHKLE